MEDFLVRSSKPKGKLLVIPLGGLGEIGKNMTVFQYGDDIVILDAGLSFPEDDMLGIDLVIPDMSYLFENRDKVRGVVLTHGHEDHIGALSYLLREVNVPVYGSRLALGLVEGRLKENRVGKYNLVPTNPGDELTLGVFKIGFIQGSHSIPDACGIYFKTPVGTVVHTGDFKIDQTPVDNKLIDIHKFAELGNQGVMLLMSDSTNAERPGYTASERTVTAALDVQFRAAKNRIIMASFASNVLRVGQAIQTAAKYGRKVVVMGRSMVNVVGISTEMGYLDIPEGVLIEPEEMKNYRDDQLLILTTGSQGEPMAGLSRMASGTHRSVAIVPGDTVIFSATPIPGNEKSVSRTIDSLLRLGAHVIYERSSGVHVSGHASREELKLMLNLVRPKYFIPVHGEYRMLRQHGALAEEMGVPSENVFYGENGHVFEFTRKAARMAGKVKAGRVFIDGLGVGDVGNIVIRDRQQLANEGVIIVVVTLDKQRNALLSGPDLVSRGFVYVRDAGGLMNEAQQKVRQALDRCSERNLSDWSSIKVQVKETLGKFLMEKTGRRPMILPIIMEV
ncbi:ribonuclease J [Anaeromusa sp.]|uniref:ribonuclease J n=1 Tax=Anaeromusa sp. TaxID=1872520 RepID=UPI0029C7B51B|nr:ribonuclease J [Anaeromusa sp.]MEA4834206.1 ribonuclease J [Anaeromusa sp.]NCB77202.1 ribonuclease J [Negativicutes bacterium]